MRNAKTVTILLGAILIAGCGSNDQQNSDQNSAAGEVPSNQVAANADIEMLPADESSATSSTELQNGIDAPETNETATNAM
jgi:PBP1b-binding outer membrane lipoprotein LpoB